MPNKVARPASIHATARVKSIAYPRSDSINEPHIVLEGLQPMTLVFRDY
jgi:hypothetical protein